MYTVDEPLYQRLRDAAVGAFEGLPVLFAYLFGSVVSDRAHIDSDVDVAVYLEAGVSSDRFLDLSLELVRRLSEASGVGRIDILVLNEASLPILGRVVRGRAVLYSRDEPARVRFESRTLREFFDYEFHARPLDQKFLRDTAEGRR
jgi:predicted nucleotidyltransferase